MDRRVTRCPIGNMKKIAKVPEQNARKFLAFSMALLLLAVFWVK
jgi:hypothetical protein